MSSVYIEPHYLPSLEYFTVLAQSEKLFLDIESPFKKQTFRNRTYLLTANGLQSLIVPVHFNQGTKFKDVTIDYRQSWVREHWGAIYSAYGKAAFFEFFSDVFHDCLHRKPKFLFDLNHALLSACFRLLQWQIDIQTEMPESGLIDLRDQIKPKESFELRDFYQPKEYPQNFGSTFVSNLSILDLLMNQGSESGKILQSSIRTPIERFSR